MNEPTPPAMTMVRATNRVPAEVLTSKRPSGCAAMAVTCCDRWKVGAIGATCVSKRSTSSRPVHTGTAGMS